MINDLEIRNEVNPHFFLNSFTTLAHLINADSEKAYHFNNKMAQVYKYFLINKKKTLVSVADEIAFIEDYFFLLRVRHDNKLDVTIEPSLKADQRFLIVPFVLQFLVDYAVKNTSFSDTTPLEINLKMNEHSLEVVYQSPLLRQPQKLNEDFASIDMHYQRCCNKNVAINKNGNKFIISLPLLTTS